MTDPSRRTLVDAVMHCRVVAIDPGASLSDAARALRSANVGALAVMDDLGGADDATIAGILSERDVVDAVASGLDLAATPVRDAMSCDPRYLTVNDHVVTAVEVMLDAGVRHLPVLEEGELVGIISMRDLLPLALGEARAASASPAA